MRKRTSIQRNLVIANMFCQFLGPFVISRLHFIHYRSILFYFHFSMSFFYLGRGGGGGKKLLFFSAQPRGGWKSLTRWKQLTVNYCIFFRNRIEPREMERFSRIEKSDKHKLYYVNETVACSIVLLRFMGNLSLLLWYKDKKIMTLGGLFVAPMEPDFEHLLPLECTTFSVRPSYLTIFPKELLFLPPKLLTSHDLQLWEEKTSYHL